MADLEAIRHAISEGHVTVADEITFDLTLPIIYWILRGATLDQIREAAQP